MKKFAQCLDRVSHSWLIAWSRQWWLMAALYLFVATWWLGQIFPNSGISELGHPTLILYNMVFLSTAIVQGGAWLLRRR